MVEGCHEAPEGGGARSAKSISVGHCRHGTITVYLHGDDGAVFAYASMGAEVAVSFNDDLVDHVEDVVTAMKAGTLVEPGRDH